MCSPRLGNGVPALVMMNGGSSSMVLFQVPPGTGLGDAFFQVDLDVEASPEKVLSNQLLRPVNEVAPAIFPNGAAYHLDESPITEQQPALPGETVLITGITGLGDAASPALTVMVGGLNAQVVSLQESVWSFEFTGISTLEMVVPEGLGPGSYPVKLTIKEASFQRLNFLIVGSDGGGGSQYSRTSDRSIDVPSLREQLSNNP